MPMNVICYGDSNTCGYDPREPLGGRFKSCWVDLLAEKTGWNIDNQGENGREVPKGTVSFPENPDLLIVMLGTNDLLQFWTPEAIGEKMAHFLSGLPIPRENILLIAPPPMVFGAWVEDQELIDDSRKLAVQYRAVASRMGTRFLDAGDWAIELGHDGVHFTEKGHRVFAAGLYAFLISAYSDINHQMQPIVDMIDCISVQNMRDSDAYTIARFTSGTELMHRAALGVFHAVSWKEPIAIVAGSGNNGGDGFALAEILRSHGRSCTVFTVSQRLSQDSAYYAEKARACGVPIRPFEEGCLSGFSTLVDCLLGTGFQGGLRDSYRRAIHAINQSDAFVVSVDINSGMNGDTGDAELAVFSDITVTIGYVKTGLVSDNAGKYMKKLICARIGIRLAREEFKILPAGTTPSDASQLPCPPWLDMTPITVYE